MEKLTFDLIFICVYMCVSVSHFSCPKCVYSRAQIFPHFSQGMDFLCQGIEIQEGIVDKEWKIRRSIGKFQNILADVLEPRLLPSSFLLENPPDLSELQF